MLHISNGSIRRCCESMERVSSQFLIGVQNMKNFGIKALLRIAALAAAGTALSGCVYDVGLGYASDGYYDDYGCDPYGGYDSYYDCDYRSGFYNIGYGGGWYDNYWYPGYGFFLFDNYGQRYNMRDNHRRYWGEKRHSWYRENRHGGREGEGYRGRGRGYSDSATPGTIGWPERNGGRVREGERRGRGDGRRGRNDQWRGGDGTGANAVPVPAPDVVQGRGRNRGEGYGRRQRGNDGNANAVPQPRRERQEAGRGGEGRAYRQPPPAQATGQSDAPVYRPAPARRDEGGRQQAPRTRSLEGTVERPD
jgi:hypothetical protein